MGITKTDGFESKTNDLAVKLKALGHPARWAIIEYLSKKDSCICNDIVDELPLAQPTISRHLSELKKVGLIKGTIAGKNVCYCINTDEWNNVLSHFQEINFRLMKNENCC